MVNGAGLAMATMDIIKLAGGSRRTSSTSAAARTRTRCATPSGSCSPTPTCRAVLINIFGGILRCDVLAEGVIAAVRDLSVKVPVVVRMKGNNEERGRQMLEESGLDFATADDMAEAAAKVVAAAQGGAR